jgi:hypothetical protein
MEIRHPKYYKELRKRNKPAGTGGALCVDPEAGSDQSISLSPGDGQVGRSTGPGLKQQATSSQASSGKHQAPSSKRQASSRKRQAP